MIRLFKVNTHFHLVPMYIKYQKYIKLVCISMKHFTCIRNACTNNFDNPIYATYGN